jgi:hypothetical protein
MGLWRPTNHVAQVPPVPSGSNISGNKELRRLKQQRDERFLRLSGATRPDPWCRLRRQVEPGRSQTSKRDAARCCVPVRQWLLTAHTLVIRSAVILSGAEAGY